MHFIDRLIYLLCKRSFWGFVQSWGNATDSGPLLFCIQAFFVFVTNSCQALLLASIRFSTVLGSGFPLKEVLHGYGNLLLRRSVRFSKVSVVI